jgi:drug/metabolite transporter (DMT)-like permease
MKNLQEKSPKQEFIAYFLLLLTMVIWGGTWPLGRWLVSEEVGGATIPPFMIAFIRYFLAVICFLIILKLKEGKLNWNQAKKNWKVLFLMGLLSVTLYQSGYLFGEIFTAASDASIMVATNAIWVVILSSIFLKTEHFTWKKMLGALMGFSAVIIVVGFSPNVNVLNRIAGDVLILLAAFSYAIYTVISRYFLNKTKDSSFKPSSIWIMTWVSFFGLLTTTPIALILSPEYLNILEFFTVPPRVWFGIFYLAFISTIGAYTFYLEGVKRLNASRAAIFQTLVPLFGVLFSAIFLQEEFDIVIYPFSLLLVISGITLVNLKTSKKEKSTSSYQKTEPDFNLINQNEAIIQIEDDYNMFIAALVKMKMVDNFDHSIPSGLGIFSRFFFSNHEIIYNNEKNPKKIYSVFLKWLNNEKNNYK